jgi:two-component system, cell cycle sensor histidine kinase and response regulator CckA
VHRPLGNRLAVALLGLVVTALAVGELLSDQSSMFDTLSIIALGAAATAAARLLNKRTEAQLGAFVVSARELQIRLDQQQAVAQLGQLALTSVADDTLFDEAVRLAAVHLSADFAAIIQRSDDGGFDFRAAVGWSHTARIPDGESSHGGYTLLAREPVIMHDSSCEKRFRISEAMADEGITSGLCAPVGSNGGSFGVIGVHMRAKREFSRHDASFLAAVATVIASAIGRRVAEAEAGEAHGVLKAVIEGTSDHIFVKDPNGRLVVINASAARTLGKPVDELLGRTLHDVLPRATADAIAATDRLTIERGTVETLEETIPVDGSNRVFLTTKGPFRAQDGTLLGTFGIAHDITRRKERERALAESEERLRLAIEGADMGTWDIDLRTGATTWSDGLRAVYGVDAEYPAGFAHLEPLIHPDDRERVAQGVTTAYVTGAPFEFECRLTRPDGEQRWILARSTCFRDECGKPTRVLGVSIDITDQKLAQEELLRVRDERVELELRLHQSEKLEAVGRLAGGVAHDFNNLLVVIRGYGDLALSRLARGDAGAGEYITASLVAADRAAGLTKQLLAFARRQVLNPEVLDLNEIVEETNGLLERLIGDQVELETIVYGRPVVVKADKGQLQQVLMNLAVNGRDAMPRGGKLTVCVAVDEPNASALLTVTDEGSGIAGETAEHIFEPFFTTKGEDGTGLGLATVHGIVTQSGGEIALDTKLGCGTTFTVSLPLCSQTIAVAKPMETRGAPTGTEAVLLVEDDPMVQLVVSTMLETYGYDVVTAGGGEEAIATFAASELEIALVVSDLMMRGLDGQQTVDRIRELAPTTRGLFMSGYTDGLILRGDALDERTGFIQKPFTGEQLANRVRDLLDHVAA